MQNLIDLFKSPFSIRIAAAVPRLHRHLLPGQAPVQQFQSAHRLQPKHHAGEVDTTPFVAISPNSIHAIDIFSPISKASTQVDPLPPPVLTSSAPPPSSEKFGVVDQNGEMKEDFDVGLFDIDARESLALVNGTEIESGMGERRVRVDSFQPCVASMREYIPCMDINLEAIEKFKQSERGERFERHCPVEGKGLSCLVPAPEDYKTPIP